jgi:hypothetical protein
MAVLQRAVADARSGSVEKKKNVRWCMKYGALPLWIDVVADTEETVEAITREIWKMVR